MKNKTIMGLLLVPALILLVPLIAMQFTAEVNWDISDFIVMGILLYGAVFAFILLSKITANSRQRAVIGLVIAAGVLWLWAELAVGIFTNWGS